MKVTINEMEKMLETYTLSAKTIDDLYSILHVFNLNKHQIFLKEGQICDYWSYIAQGLVRIFYYKRRKEVIDYFASEGDYFFSAESYFKRTPSVLIQEALEPSIIYAFRYDEFEELCRKNSEVGLFFRKTIENSLINAQHRLDSLQFETAQERYEKLAKDIPQIILRVPSIYIASYLGITPETLSRVRAKSNISIDICRHEIS